MEKLELKHLAPYLPYGLIFHGESCGFNENFYPVMSINDSEYEETSIFTILNEQWKPILRPLSDLTKEIDVNGEKIIPINYLCEQVLHELRRIIEHFIIYGSYGELPYWVSLYLFECHFDVFGLIEKGLAIDINTLNYETKH